jgi:preprotein translocase subunit SecF
MANDYINAKSNSRVIDFLKYRFFTAVISVCIIGVFVGSYIYKVKTRGYAFSYSVDFTGGTQVLLKVGDGDIEGSFLRSILEKGGWANPVIREFGSGEYLVRVKEFSSDVKGLAEKIRSVIASEVKRDDIIILQSETVGPGVGAELRWNSQRAILFALLAILFYIAFIFWSFSFAIGAIVALLHDALVMLAVFLLFDRDISINVIGAILAVLGYSINDTIVIFSRIRNNISTMEGVSLYDVVNKSIHQMLKRTLLTSVSTALAVVSLLFLGGEPLRDFSLTLLVGIIFGTYSSMYIASPVMMLLYKEDKE